MLLRFANADMTEQCRRKYRWRSYRRHVMGLYLCTAQEPQPELRTATQ
mgnify:CR=1 FL=1